MNKIDWCPRIFRFLLVAFLASTLLTPTVLADWPMYRHDATHSGVSDDEVVPPLEFLWKYEVDYPFDDYLSFASPAISNGVVYIGYDGYACALDMNTGNVKWKHEINGIIASSPAISNGIVYVSSIVDEFDDGVVYALDANTGTVKWKYKTNGIIVSSPAISNGVVYIGSIDDNYKDGFLHALDANTGSLKWEYKTNGTIASSPAISNGVVYVSSIYGELYALYANTGKLIWINYDVPNNEVAGEVALGPVVYDNKVYVSSTNGIYAIDADMGSLIWEYNQSNLIYPSPAISDGVVYVGSVGDEWDETYGELYALDSNTGRLKWLFETNDFLVPTPVVSNDVLYGSSSGGDNEYSYGNIFAINKYTGEPIWEYTVDGAIYSLVISDGMLFVYSSSSDYSTFYLYAFASSTSTSQDILNENPASENYEFLETHSNLSTNEIVQQIKNYVVKYGKSNDVSFGTYSYKDEKYIDSEGVNYEFDIINGNKYYYIVVDDYENDGVMDSINFHTAISNTDLTYMGQVEDIFDRYCAMFAGRDPSILESRSFYDEGIDSHLEIYQSFSVLDYNLPSASDYDKGLINEKLVDERPNSIADSEINYDFRVVILDIYQNLIAAQEPTIIYDGKTPYGTENVAEENVAEENVAEENIAEENVAEENVADDVLNLLNISILLLITIILLMGFFKLAKKRKAYKSSNSKKVVESSVISQSKLLVPIDKLITSSAFGYKGATILHKIKIENLTSEPIGDIKIHLFVPDVFLLVNSEKSISMLEPNESKTVTFEIRPTGECGDCNVSGRVNFYDYGTKNRQEIDLETKSLSVVCPLLKIKDITITEWRNITSHLIKTEETTREISMPAETLFSMASRVIEDMNMFMLEPEITSTAQMYNGVARFYGEGIKELKYAAQIEVVGSTKRSKLILKAWAEREDALTGFYHGILDELEKRVQVKGYIDDSIVQNFYHYGDNIRTQVKDSFVYKSNVGTGTGKCPNCGREVDAAEKFCLECGTKL